MIFPSIVINTPRLWQFFVKFWTPHFSFLDSTLFRLDSTFWLDSTLKLNYGLYMWIIWSDCFGVRTT